MKAIYCGERHFLGADGTGPGPARSSFDIISGAAKTAHIAICVCSCACDTGPQRMPFWCET